MNKTCALALSTVMAFLLSAIAITAWFLYETDQLMAFELAAAKDFILKYGWRFGCIIASFFLLLCLIFLKDKRLWVRGLLMAALLALLAWALWDFFWYFVIREAIEAWPFR